LERIKKEEKTMKTKLALSVFLISLMLITTQTGYGGLNPPQPPPNSTYGNFVGPDVTGTLTVDKTFGMTYFTFDGKCKNIPVYDYLVLGPEFFDGVNEEYLLGDPEWPDCEECSGPYGLPVPDDCVPTRELVDLKAYFYKVTDFSGSDDKKVFKVVLRFLTAVPIK
jgi:hypothetical protein